MPDSTQNPGSKPYGNRARRQNLFNKTTFSKSRQRPFKRIVALSDGTWQSAESDEQTNIVRLTEAIMQEDPNGIQQVVFYDPGVGLSTDAVHAHSLTEKLSGGILGHGLDTNVKQLYTSIALNYDPGDELYLFGFSRGAYTVRSLAGLIHACGIVPRHRLHDVHEAYEAYRSGNPMRVYFFRKGERTEIAALVCFDTVGALGVPKTVFGWELPDRWREKYQFHDVTVNESVRNAVHVLSIDEDRAAYMPTPMRPHATCSASQVTSRFFWGGHGGVGGGQADQRLNSDITLRFVIDELSRRGCGLCFDAAHVPSEYPDETAAPKDSEREMSLSSRITRFVTGMGYRHVQTVKDVHWSAIRHFQADKRWRPPGLRMIEKDMMKCDWKKKRDEELVAQ